MDWDDAAREYHRRTFDDECRLTALPVEWQRELAALWRFSTDVWNGLYLQFLGNWGRESYLYASQAFKKIGAHKMADIIDRCQGIIDEHCPPTDDDENYRDRLEGPLKVHSDGTLRRGDGGLDDEVCCQIHDLSHDMMDYPDSVADLARSYYGPMIEADPPAATPC